MKVEKRYAIRYSNQMYHRWDDLGEFDYALNVNDAHLALSHRAAEEIANVIRKCSRLKCEIVEVGYGYLFIGNARKRLR